MKGIICQCIHGGREQYDREQALADFKSGDVKILIATDVASRGLDIEDIT
jgi:ATP-dependent RNA helicase DDX43